MPDRYRCPSCGTHCVVPSLAKMHCKPVGHDGHGAPLYRWQTDPLAETRAGEPIIAVDEPNIAVG